MTEKCTGIAGLWHITEMEGWDESYYNMAVQAFVRIKEDGYGEFQIGLVEGSIRGDIGNFGGGDMWGFDWEGCDECDPADGSGDLTLKTMNEIEGEISIQQGDTFEFKAKRVK